jgi:HlyD family secretion protein
LVVKTPFKTAALQQDYVQYWAQQGSFDLAGRKALTEFARQAMLEARGIATRQELENARYEVDRITAEARLLAEQTLARWQKRLEDERFALAGLLSEEQRLREEQLLYVLRAPADGQLLGFDGWSAGAFVAAGQSLGVLSPDNTLQVETWVSPRDIGLVRVGQDVRLQIDAFPYTDWGTLEGKVTVIGGDLAPGTSLESNTPAPGFKVMVQPAATYVTLSDGTRGVLRKGLTLTARFLVARRSVLQLLYDDASAWFDPSYSG